MLIPEAKAWEFINGYRDLLERFTGKRLRSSATCQKARDQWFAQGRPIKDEWEVPAALAASLQSAFFGKVIIMRHLKTGTEVVYGDDVRRKVRGLTTPLEEMIEPWSVVETVVCQFHNQWITDGLLADLQVFIGPGLQRDLRRKPEKR